MSGLLCDLVLAQASVRPDALAVRTWDSSLTYREMAERAATLATVLIGHGVGPEVRVGVSHSRDPSMLVAILGIMQAGGAYVPLDPTHPPARNALVRTDADITIAVVDDAGASALAGSDLTMVRVPTQGAAVAAVSRASADNAAYVLYTSGSTGQPKGVVVTHRNAVAFITTIADMFGLDERCRGIGFGALSFDASVLDIFAPLSRGGSVALIPEADRIDPSRLQACLEAHRVTWGVLPPALLPLLDPDRLTELRHALAGGEPPGPEQVARWSAPPERLFYNLYGPTEATVCTVATELTGHWDTPLPIGHALPGCQVYVLDEQMRPCPVGSPGELHIGGPQVARGYLGRPGLTAERFVPDPYGDVPGARLYRTGDLVVRDPEHGIRFMGRLDRQVKISGQRVELGEVEAALRGHPAVAQAVADVGAGPTELVAYLSPATAPDLAELRDYCAERLPVYMTPTRVVRLDTLPLNTSGKVDMAALRAAATASGTGTEPERGGERAAYTPMQRAVAAVWSRVLAVPEPGLTDDFFTSGGHSLLAMRLVAAVRAELGRAVTVEDIVEGRTLAGLAARAEKAEQPGTVRVRTGHTPTLSSAQRRVWFVDKLAKETPAYNIAFAERLHGPLDAPALAEALRTVAARHEVLRWRFPDAGGVPYVHVDPAANAVPLPTVDLSELPAQHRERILRERLELEARDRFDLAEDALWRARLFRLTESDHVLAITVHHIVFDGWSQDILYRDLGLAYAEAVNGREPDLGELPATFADYAAWLRERDREHAEAAVAWWSDRLRGTPTVLDLPRDHARPPVQTYRGAAARAEVTAAPAEAVRDLAGRLGTTPYAVLLSAFAQQVRRLTGQRDLIIGAPVADRRHPDFEPMIGFCVDTVPVRLSVDDSLDFAAHVRACGDTLMSALAQADTPLDRIVGTLGADRDLSRNPLVQVLFNMYNFTQPTLDLPGLRVESFPAGLPGSLFDLTLYLSDKGDGYALQAVYNPDLYGADRIEALLTGYTRMIGELVADPDRPVGAASLRPPGRHGSVLPEPARPLPGWDGPGVVERVAAAARSTMDTVAITGPDGKLDYRDLLDHQRRVSAAIRAAGFHPGTPVGVLATRDVALPALLLGVLASGARWAVLDASLPPARLAAQARAAGCQALLTCPGATPPAELAHLPVITEDDVTTVDVVSPVGERGYISFTSGTTGEPKAVLAGERPLAHFVDWYPSTMGLRADDRFALLGGLAHDPLLRDVFTPLALGAVLCVPPAELLRDPVRLARWLATEAVTVLHLTPQLARLLTALPGTTLPAVRLVATGGDQLTSTDVIRLRAIAPEARIVNLYGTTETPQAQAYHVVPDGLPADAGPVPVGRGIDGAQLLVLGPTGQPAGVGELGEVVIRSRYLATGYATEGRLDGERTAARFQPAGDGSDQEDRMYATGDLGRYRPDGEVVLAGRDDDQVKIRGFRLELGEVEAALLAHPDVRTATAVADIEHDEPVIRAYAIPATAGLTVEALRDHLGTVLPAYAMPASVTLLPALPLTANGKVDRAALPRPSARPRTSTADEPTTATEHLIAGVWREVLALPRVGVADNFFEVGGHSIAIVVVQAKLTGLLGREVDILDLFRHPNIRALGAHLDGATRGPGLDRAAQRVAARRDRNRRTTANRSGATANEEDK